MHPCECVCVCVCVCVSVCECVCACTHANSNIYKSISFLIVLCKLVDSAYLKRQYLVDMVSTSGKRLEETTQ